MQRSIKKTVITLGALFFSALGHETAKGQTTFTAPTIGHVYHVGDTIHSSWTSPDTVQQAQLSIRDTRYDPNLGSGEGFLMNFAHNPGHFDWVVPASWGELSFGVLGASTYRIAVYFGTESVAFSDSFTIVPQRASDTGIHASFTLSDTLLCHSGYITFANTSSCVDSADLPYSWNLGSSGYYLGKNLPPIWFQAYYWWYTNRTLSLLVVDTTTGAYRFFTEKVGANPLVKVEMKLNKFSFGIYNIVVLNDYGIKIKEIGIPEF